MRYKLQSLDNEILITIFKYEEQKNQSETSKKLYVPSHPYPSNFLNIEAFRSERLTWQ